MVVYRREEKHPFRWVLAIILFILVLTVTFDEVVGATHSTIPAVQLDSPVMESQVYRTGPTMPLTVPAEDIPGL